MLSHLKFFNDALVVGKCIVLVVILESYFLTTASHRDSLHQISISNFELLH